MITHTYSCDLCSTVANPDSSWRLHFMTKGGFELVPLHAINASEKIICGKCLVNLGSEWDRINGVSS